MSYCGDKAINRKSDKPVRNIAINRSNSYSTLFADSTTLESFIKDQNLNDTISHDMRVFYNARNFQFAWFSGDGLTEQTFSFRSLYDYSNDSIKKRPLDFKLDNLMLNDSLKSLRASRNITKTEFLFTWRFIQYLWDNYPNKKTRNNILVKFVPAQKQDPMQRAEGILEDGPSGSNAAYKALNKVLDQYVKIEQNDGWPKIPVKNKKFKLGKSDTVIAIIKKRLAVTGDFPKNDSSSEFTPQLQDAIKNVERNFGLKPDGVINTSLIQ
jgi:murein L,D-transpeptidase YcbB/YkuD